jgi:hypothetical protein
MVVGASKKRIRLNATTALNTNECVEIRPAKKVMLKTGIEK